MEPFDDLSFLREDSIESCCTHMIDCSGFVTTDPIKSWLIPMTESDLYKRIVSVRYKPTFCKIPYPKKILYHGVATIVFWEDGTKTVVKRAEGDPDNHYNAFCSALAIKIYGNNSRVNKHVKSGITQK